MRKNVLILCLSMSSQSAPLSPTIEYLLGGLGMTALGMNSFPRETLTLINRFMMFPQAEIGQLSARQNVEILLLRTLFSCGLCIGGTAHSLLALNHLKKTSDASTNIKQRLLAQTPQKNETQNI